MNPTISRQQIKNAPETFIYNRTCPIYFTLSASFFGICARTFASHVVFSKRLQKRRRFCFKLYEYLTFVKYDAVVSDAR